MGKGEMSGGGSRNKRLFLVASSRRRRPVGVYLTRMFCVGRVGMTNARSSNIRIDPIIDPGASDIVPEILVTLRGVDNEWKGCRSIPLPTAT